MFKMGHKKAAALANEAISKAIVGLSADTEASRAQVFETLMEAITFAESKRYKGHNAKLFQHLGDLYLQAGDVDTAYDAYGDAVFSPNGVGDPEIHLRLGRILYDRKNFEKAGDELARALIMGGKKIFEGEPDEYFEFITDRLDPPPEGWDNFVPLSETD